jgi:GT2 family glycosyltransferase
MDLSIVIVTHNSREPVERCLESLNRFPPRCSFETIVIDNASCDGTPEMVADRFPRVGLVANPDNRGYSRGVNQGIALASGAGFLVLNPDIVVGEGAIDRLVEFMESTPDAGIMGAKLVYPDGALQYSCRSFYTVSALILRRTFLGKLFPRAEALRQHLMLDYDHATPRAVDWVVGACMLVRREALEQVGAMDERFFLYFEDIDWCYRMKNRGWSVYYVPDSVMVHTYQRASAKSMLRKPFLIHLLSLLRYYEKWNRVFYFARRHRGALKTTVLVLSDLVALNLSFFAGYYARSLMQPLFIHSLYPVSWYGYLILFYNIIFLVIFLFGGLYRVHRETPRAEEVMRITRSVFLGFVILLAATYISRVRIYSRAVLIGQAVIAVFAVSLLRMAVRHAHRELVRARFDLRRVLIVGEHEEAVRLAEELGGNSAVGIDVVGYVNGGPQSLGPVADVAAIAERFKVQEVIVCDSHSADPALAPFLGFSRRRMIEVKVASSLARFLGPGARVEALAGIPVFSLQRRTLLQVERALKRSGDVAAGLLWLPLASFGSLVCRLYGKISGRARFWTETRRGRGGVPLAWPRAATRSGRELADAVKPGLCIALIAGRVSIVGPPALLPAQCGGAPAELAGERPGITGAWRLERAGRLERSLEDEAFRIGSWSIWGDLIIIAGSLGALLGGSYPAWFGGEGEAPCED